MRRLSIAILLTVLATVAPTTAESPLAESFHAKAGEVTLHGARAGSGPAVVLLHGWPQSHREWDSVVPLLADAYDVLAFDLRGSGDSSKPAEGYDQRTLAHDVVAALDSLAIDRVHLVGHDIGGMVAFAFAHEHGERLLSLTILDVPLPGTPTFDAIARDPRAWHFGFHRTPDLPEALVQGRERLYVEHFIRSLAVQTNRALEHLDVYARNLSNPAALRAGFEYYRAFPTAESQNARYFEDKLTMPVLALSGGAPWTYEMMKPLALHVEGGAIDGSGHWLAEEQPEALAARLRAFFAKAER
ncbi:MAG: alpha/beta hydrolase [Acidobacteriota bacterium]